jgi:hypothetical protein
MEETKYKSILGENCDDCAFKDKPKECDECVCIDEEGECIVWIPVK